MDALVAQHYNLELGSFDSLERRIIDDYDAEAWGLERYSSIANATDRAVASDLLISLLDGVKTAVLDLAISSDRYAALVGPNGRTMPGPETTLESRVEVAELETASTGCFRALGSALDCLAALAILLTGI